MARAIILCGKSVTLRWIVVQDKGIKGRFIEKLGEWRPNYKAKTYDRSYYLNLHRIDYWLGCGAVPSRAVERILERYDILPPRPVPGGTKQTYEKPEGVEPVIDVDSYMK